MRADSHYCCPEVLDLCRAEGLHYILGVAPTSTLRKHVVALEVSTKARYEAAPKDGKARRYKEFYDGAAIGAASSASSPASRLARTGRTPASSSPI